MNNFILKLPDGAVAGFADCTISAPVLAFDPSTGDRIAALVQPRGCQNPTGRVGKVH